MKLLLYCTKAKPYLYPHFNNLYFTRNKDFGNVKLNGKIVAECDFEVEWCDTSWCCSDFIEHKGLEKSCLTTEQLFDYVKGKNEFCAIHIKNLHIFDEPKKLRDYKGDSKGNFFKIIEKAPQNMQMVLNEKLEDCILISIRPEWLCKILNGEKTIEVRKKVLKEMLKC